MITDENIITYQKSELQCQECLPTGFGKSYITEITHKNERTHCVVKSDRWFGSLSEFNKEIETLQWTSGGKNLAMFLGAVTHSNADDSRECGYILELADMSMNELFHSGKYDIQVKLTNDHVQSWATQVLDGLEYLHEKGIVHKNLKTKNVLLFNHGLCCKLTDFGMSRTTVLGNFENLKIENNTVQTAAPELFTTTTTSNCTATNSSSSSSKSTTSSRSSLFASHTPSPATDIYSFGILLWEMHTLKSPWDGLTDCEIFLRVVKNNERPDCSQLDDSVKQILEKCWCQNPKERVLLPALQCVFKEKLKKFSQESLKNIYEYDDEMSDDEPLFEGLEY